MKKIILVLFLYSGLLVNAQNNDSAFKSGEWLKFRVHYSIFNGGVATLHLTNDVVNGVSVYHVKGEGKTTGIASLFKVNDVYESYFDKKDGKPYKFVRNINEGGYTKDMEIDFDYDSKEAVLNDKKNNKKLNFTIGENIQDLISAFYFIRNNYEFEDLVENEFIELNMLYDDDGIFQFKLKYLGKEIIKNKYGKVECLKFRPYVQSGRVFKEKESLALWVSNDLNKIPIRIKADLAVGSIRADLDGYNGLKNQFKIIID